MNYPDKEPGDEDLIQITPDEDTSLIEIAPDPVAEAAVEKPVKERRERKPAEPMAPEDAVDDIKRELEASRAQAEARAREAEATLRALEAERASRVKLEDDLLSLRDQGLRSQWHLVNSELQQIANGIASINQEREAAKRDYKIAFEANDAEAVASAQERMALAAADLRTLEQGKVGAEQEVRRTEAIIRRAREAAAAAEPRRAEQPRAEPQPEKKTQTPDDWIGQVRNVYGAKPADWLKEHPEFVTDPKLNQKMLKFAEAYQTIEEKPLDSKEFITALNSKFFPQETDMADEEDHIEPEVEQPKPQARKSAPAAPVSRNASPSQPSSSGGQFKLTQEQFAIAPDLYSSYDDLSPETKRKFPSWSPTAARWEYHANLRRAEKDNKFRL